MHLITRQLCLTQHLGTKEILFGGQMLAWADIAASIWCREIARSESLVTVHMSDVNFVSAVRVDDIAEFYGIAYKVGKTSITVRIVVQILESRSGSRREAFRFTATMVNIDRNLRPAELPKDIQQTTYPDDDKVHPELDARR